jgi:hypothetical protein
MAVWSRLVLARHSRWLCSRTVLYNATDGCSTDVARSIGAIPASGADTRL